MAKEILDIIIVDTNLKMGQDILKNLIVYRKTKNKYQREQSDIPQIIKKESKDIKAQEEKEKLAQQIEEPVKRKRGRPRKVKTE